MLGTILETADLLAITGYTKPGDAARELRRQGIRVFHGRPGVIWTTVGLVEAAGGITPRQQDEFYSAEDAA